jgi:hypothetical protein
LRYLSQPYGCIETWVPRRQGAPVSIIIGYRAESIDVYRERSARARFAPCAGFERAARAAAAT